jgi:hypothetical protein
VESSYVHRLSTFGVYLLSFAALMTLLPGAVRAVVTGYVPPPDPDEGTLAHIFQLSIVGLAPIGLAFLATADWSRPRRIVLRLAAPAGAVMLAFAILYYWEKYYPAHHG